MVYNSQRGRGFNDIFGTLNRTFKPVIEGAADVGANLATGLVSDLLSGKGPKASIKERGNQAKRIGCPTCITKVFKVEAGQNVNERNVKQTGGIYPPIHYPAGNYPGYDMVGRGIYEKMRREMEKDCKDWYKRQQKGGRVRKRKPKKQTGAGKKRKQKGSGKKTGKKRKSRKQTGDGLWSGIKEIFE